MKKTILILLFGLLTVVGLPMVTEAAEPVDATDATIFGAQAMVPNSTEDQTEKLQTLLSQTAKEGRALFLPQGSYALSKDIAIYFCWFFSASASFMARTLQDKPKRLIKPSASWWS